MSIRYVTHDVVARVEERVARQWVRGTGDKAVFRDGSEGWYVVLSSHLGIYLGPEKPALEAGDRVRVTIERA